MIGSTLDGFCLLQLASCIISKCKLFYYHPLGPKYHFCCFIQSSIYYQMHAVGNLIKCSLASTTIITFCTLEIIIKNPINLKSVCLCRNMSNMSVHVDKLARVQPIWIIHIFFSRNLLTMQCLAKNSHAHTFSHLLSLALITACVRHGIASLTLCTIVIFISIHISPKVTLYFEWNFF